MGVLARFIGCVTSLQRHNDERVTRHFVL